MADLQATRDVHDCQALLASLNPGAVHSKAAEMTRGGLPGSSMSDGRGGGTGRIGFDRPDKEIKRRLKVYDAAIREAMVALQRAKGVQGEFLDAVNPAPDPCCEIAGCENVLTDRSSGKCGMHRQRDAREKRKIGA